MSTIKVNNLQHPTAANANITLDANGWIGVGTSTPSYALDINGTINVASILVNGSSVVTSAYNTTNSAFAKANNALPNTTGTLAGSLTITGTVGIGTGYQSGSNLLTIGDPSTSTATQVNINDNGSGFARLFLNSQGSRSIFMQTNSLGATSYGMQTGTVGFSQIGYSPYVFCASNTEFLRITAGRTGIGALSIGESSAYSLITVNASPTFSDSGGLYWTHINGGNSTVGSNTPWLAVLNSANVATSTFGWAFYDSSGDGSLNLQSRSGSTTGATRISINRGNGLVDIPGRLTGSSLPVGSVIQTVFKNLGSTPSYYQSGTSARSNTNFNATFTPRYSTSKVFHIIVIGFYANCDGNLYIYRNGSIVSDSLGDSMRTITYSDASVDWFPITVTWQDSPGSTSALTYSLYAQATGCGQTMYLGTSGDFVPTWTIMEIAQ